MFNFIKTNYTAFDEEQGEISLSILSRIVAAKPIHSDIDSMNKYYPNESSQSHYLKIARISEETINKLVIFLIILKLLHF